MRLELGEMWARRRGHTYFFPLPPTKAKQCDGPQPARRIQTRKGKPIHVNVLWARYSNSCLRKLLELSPRRLKVYGLKLVSKGSDLFNERSIGINEIS